MSECNWLIVSQNISCDAPLQIKTWLGQSEMHYLKKFHLKSDFSNPFGNHVMGFMQYLPTSEANLLLVKQPYRNYLSNFLEGRWNCWYFEEVEGKTNKNKALKFMYTLVSNYKNISLHFKLFVIFSITCSKRTGKLPISWDRHLSYYFHK